MYYVTCIQRYVAGILLLVFFKSFSLQKKFTNILFKNVVFFILNM